MKRWLLAGGVLLAVTLTVILKLRGAVTGVGYMIQGGGIVQVEDRALLSQMANKIQQAGGVRATLLYVKQEVDVEEPYVGSIPSKNKPIVAMSGCRKPVKVLGLVAIMRVDVDPGWIKQVWGEETPKRVNGLLTQCLIYGMSGGKETIFNTAVPEVVGVMGGQRAFGVIEDEERSHE